MIQSGAEIFAFDLLIQNPDRRPDNLNLEFKGNQFAIFDHDLALILEGVLGWRPPWERGALEVLGAPAGHILFPALQRSEPDLERLTRVWEAIDDARLDSYRAALPSEWTPTLPTEQAADRVIDFLRELRDHIRSAMSEIARILA